MIEESPLLEPTITMDPPEETDMTEPLPEISFHAIAGMAHPQTFRVMGKLQNKAVTVLIDGGSTHNFIDQAIVTKFGLSVARDQKLQVMVANRDKIDCDGRCLALTLLIQNFPVRADFYVLPAAACQVVLGVQWLATLGPIETDYNKLTMSFQQGGKSCTFQGLQQPTPTALRDKELLNLNGTALFFQIIPSHESVSVNNHLADLAQILTEFEHVFVVPTTLPSARTHDHHIPLQPNQELVSVRPYRYPYYQKIEIERMVKEFLDSSLIRPSTNPFSSPVLLVKKTDGGWQFCIDYRALNNITIKDKYPIPVIDELLDELHGSRYFSKLDLRARYHQIRVQEADIHKTAFRTHDGHYEFVVMPFGLTNAPATFQSLMNDLLRPYLRKFVLVFFDDILVYNITWDNHLGHLRAVLQVLSSNHLFAKKSKCCFGVLQVAYLGHLISFTGVAVDPGKIKSVLEWPTPTSARGVRGFLGLAGYYRKFISGFGGIAAPLT